MPRVHGAGDHDPGTSGTREKEGFLRGYRSTGIEALREPRPTLCVEQETHFREYLAMMGCSDAAKLAMVGGPVKFATGAEHRLG